MIPFLTQDRNKEFSSTCPSLLVHLVEGESWKRERDTCRRRGLALEWRWLAGRVAGALMRVRGSGKTAASGRESGAEGSSACLSTVLFHQFFQMIGRQFFKMSLFSPQGHMTENKFREKSAMRKEAKNFQRSSHRQCDELLCGHRSAISDREVTVSSSPPFHCITCIVTQLIHYF